MGCVRRTKLRETLAERKRESADVRFAEALVVHELEAAMNMPISSATWAPATLVRCLPLLGSAPRSSPLPPA